MTAEVSGTRRAAALRRRCVGHTQAPAVNMEDIMSARVIVAVAGMEGALLPVIGGLADCPVIAVPTSVGYGASSAALRRC